MVYCTNATYGWLILWVKNICETMTSAWRHLFATMTGAPRINAWIGTRRVVYFFTFTESLLFYQAHTIQIITISQVHIMYKKNIPLLGKTVLCSGWRIPILPGPLLEVNCLYAPCLPLTPRNRFPANRTFIYIQLTITRPLFLSGTTSVSMLGHPLNDSREFSAN